MSERWLEDLKKSANIIKSATPILQEIFEDPYLTIMQVEGKDEEVCQVLDKTCGIDYLALTHNGQSFGVAWRCQWVEENKEYNTFTMRKSRDTGASTEYEKRLKAIQDKAVYPHYVVQTFADKTTNEILSLALTTTESLLDYIAKEKPTVKHTGKAQTGQASFFVIDWFLMNLYGYEITIYDHKTGIA